MTSHYGVFWETLNGQITSCGRASRLKHLAVKEQLDLWVLRPHTQVVTMVTLGTAPLSSEYVVVVLVNIKGGNLLSLL